MIGRWPSCATRAPPGGVVRVDRCFGFVDLSGFTSFTERHGDERTVLVLAELRTMLREAAARRGVRVVKWLGDGAMLSSTMVDAVVALVVEIDEKLGRRLPSLPLRAGMASGPVIMFEGDDYIGRAVNVAARLCDQARPHELLATTEVAAERPAWVGAQPATAVAVRGLATEVATRCLFLREPGDDAVTDPVCGLTLARAHTVEDDGGRRFCSAACADAWLDRRPAQPGGFGPVLPLQPTP